MASPFPKGRFKHFGGVTFVIEFVQTELFVLIIGCDGAGKTTLLEQLKQTFSKGGGEVLTPVDSLLMVIILHLFYYFFVLFFFLSGGRFRFYWSHSWTQYRKDGSRESKKHAGLQNICSRSRVY